MARAAEDSLIAQGYHREPLSGQISDTGTGTGVARRVLIVEDSAVLADALSAAIEVAPDLEVVGLATTVADALAQVQAGHPDIVLMDVILGDGDGIEATARIRALAPESRVLVLTALAEPDVLARAAIAGACGFLVKGSPLGEVVDAVRSAGAEPESKMVVEAATLRALAGRLAEPAPAASPGPAQDFAGPLSRGFTALNGVIAHLEARQRRAARPEVAPEARRRRQAAAGRPALGH